MTANKEPDEIWQRLERGRQAKAARGGYAGYGSPPFGQKSENGELVDDPLEQETIELIRRHHKSGKSLQQIADWLNEHGYRTKRGQLWRRISVKRVLDRLYGQTPRLSSEFTTHSPHSLTQRRSLDGDAIADQNNTVISTESLLHVDRL
ncbi:MAG: recombinase family protein [Cyanobacteria bacterium SID2]|nr:recombinase family protein [Cyanobacteria bacterium SID2]MBP0004446.1 recombinase family protein [Cyanobacteria bacterium SBC]